MPYQLLPFNQESGFNLEPKVAKHSFADKTGHEKGKELIDAKVEQINNNPNAFNGEKALFYFKDESQPDSNFLKIVPEDYASVSAAAEVNKNPKTLADAAEKGQFLRSHYVAGVIIACQTADDKIIIGSRDANRNKDDLTQYPLQFPCGFIDVNEAFYDKMRQGNAALLHETINGDAKRELREEVLNFDDAEILQAQPLAAIYETKQWPVKEAKGGGTKNVHVIKSFVIQVKVNATYAEVEERRDATIKKLDEDLKLDPKNKELLQQKKDFDEMKTMGCVDVARLPELLAGKANGTEVEINFDGKPRKFVAEHGITLDAVSQHLSKDLKQTPTSVAKPLTATTLQDSREHGAAEI